MFVLSEYIISSYFIFVEPFWLKQIQKRSNRKKNLPNEIKFKFSLRLSMFSSLILMDPNGTFSLIWMWTTPVSTLSRLCLRRICAGRTEKWTLIWTSLTRIGTWKTLKQSRDWSGAFCYSTETRVFLCLVNCIPQIWGV